MTRIGNRWRQLNYTLMAPIYERLIRPFETMRRRSIELAGIRAGERVLLVGAGTGADVPHIAPGAQITAVDLTPAMLRRCPPGAAELALMDGSRLALREAVFDVVLLHLIVAVIPDPHGCLLEAERVLKPGGRAMVLDKFAPEGGAPLLLRLARPVALLLGTDVTVRLREAVSRTGLAIEHEESAGLRGFYRIAALRKAKE